MADSVRLRLAKAMKDIIPINESIYSRPKSTRRRPPDPPSPILQRVEDSNRKIMDLSRQLRDLNVSQRQRFQRSSASGRFETELKLLQDTLNLATDPDVRANIQKKIIQNQKLLSNQVQVDEQIFDRDFKSNADAKIIQQLLEDESVRNKSLLFDLEREDVRRSRTLEEDRFDRQTETVDAQLEQNRLAQERLNREDDYRNSLRLSPKVDVAAAFLGVEKQDAIDLINQKGIDKVTQAGIDRVFQLKGPIALNDPLLENANIAAGNKRVILAQLPVGADAKIAKDQIDAQFSNVARLRAESVQLARDEIEARIKAGSLGGKPTETEIAQRARSLFLQAEDQLLQEQFTGFFRDQALELQPENPDLQDPGAAPILARAIKDVTNTKPGVSLDEQVGEAIQLAFFQQIQANPTQPPQQILAALTIAMKNMLRRGAERFNGNVSQFGQSVNNAYISQLGNITGLKALEAAGKLTQQNVQDRLRRELIFDNPVQPGQ